MFRSASKYMKACGVFIEYIFFKNPASRIVTYIVEVK